MRRYGVPGFRPYRPEPTYKLTAPTTVTHVDRKTISIPIRDQGNEGSCTGHGWSRAVQGALELHDPLSPQFPYFCGRLREATEAIDAGAMVGDVGDAIQEYGLPHESVYPYVVGQYAQRPTYEAFADAMQFKGKVKSLRVFGSTQIKSALAQPNTLVVFGFAVPAYFESRQMEDSGWLSVPGREQFIGGHCVIADGFDSRNTDSPEPFAWIANSWGKDWAPFGGWFKMPLRWFDDSRRLCDECYAVSPV